MAIAIFLSNYYTGNSVIVLNNDNAFFHLS